MIYSPFYRPRYPFAYSRPVNNIYTYSVKKGEKDYKNSNKKSKEFTPNIENYNCENTHSNTNSNSQIIEIFGISLCFDDLLIIALLLFLYFEGVKDEMLFLALLLILMT